MSNLVPTTVLADSRQETYDASGTFSGGGHMVTFGAKMKELREKTGMTQEALARRIDLGIGAVRDWEQGRRIPSAPSLFKLADALGVSCEAFKGCIDVGQTEEKPTKRTKRKDK
jgi:transcriptional regulator with XRE-family HTH domain